MEKILWPKWENFSTRTPGLRHSASQRHFSEQQKLYGHKHLVVWCIEATNLTELAESRWRMPESRLVEGRLNSEDPIIELAYWNPSNTKSVALELAIWIGPKNHPGADIFRIGIVTRSLQPELEGLERDHSVMFVDEFKWPDIWQGIMDTIRDCECETWKASANKLRGHFDWEYEGEVP